MRIKHQILTKDLKCLEIKIIPVIFFFFYRPTYKKVFETVRSASRASYAGMDPNQFPRIGSMTTSTLSSGSTGPRMSCGQVRPHASTFPSLDSTGHSDSEGSLLTESEDYPYVSIFFFTTKIVLVSSHNRCNSPVSEGRNELVYPVLLALLI